MCVKQAVDFIGNTINQIFGGGDPDPTPAPIAPTPPPVPTQTITDQVAPPPTPTPGPIEEDETKRKAKLTSKKVQKKKRSAGTTQLATKKPTTGGLQGINTPQGINTGTNTTT
jgi:hypothetical protein